MYILSLKDLLLKKKKIDVLDHATKLKFCLSSIDNFLLISETYKSKMKGTNPRRDCWCMAGCLVIIIRMRTAN